MKMNKLIFLLSAWGILFSLSACHSGKKAIRTVTVSILPQKYFVERIAGDYVKVNVMIPPGMNPATCDLNTNQLKQLYDSDLCFAVGDLPFEITHLYPVLKNKTDIKLVKHSGQVELLQGSCGHQHDRQAGVDPHIWLSPAYARVISRQILDALSETYPEQKAAFEENYFQLRQDIEKLDRRTRQTLEPKQHKSFLIYHPALTYFAHDYGMEQISIENEGKDPNPVHLKKIIDEARKKKIRIIFIQQQFDVNNANAIARSIGAEVVPIDPLNENWLQEMNRLITIFNQYLR